MISKVTFWVETDETTDPFVTLIASVMPSSVKGAEIIEYEVEVDICL